MEFGLDLFYQTAELVMMKLLYEGRFQTRKHFYLDKFCKNISREKKKQDILTVKYVTFFSQMIFFDTYILEIIILDIFLQNLSRILFWAL